MENEKMIVVDYAISLHGELYYDDFFFLSNNNNEFLWEAISEGCLYAVEKILKTPKLFRKETLTLDLWNSELEGEYIMRGERKFPMRATNFGTFVNLAKNKLYNEIEEALLKYYYDEIGATVKRGIP